MPARLEKFVALCNENGYPVKLVKSNVTKFEVVGSATTAPTTPVAKTTAPTKKTTKVKASSTTSTTSTSSVVPAKRGRPSKKNVMS